MNLLQEYIRKLLLEAAKGPQDLPEGIFVEIEPRPDWGVQIAYVNKLGNVLNQTSRVNGIVMAEEITEDYVSLGPCAGAWMIGSSQAAPGWGPMLYDVAMEYATMKGGGLMADRASVSPKARNVWDYYMNNRGDVTGIQMDDRKNTLTPEEEDNCSQKVAGLDNRSQQDKSKLSPTGTYKTDWIESPLSKRWTKPPTTIEALRAAGKLVWHDAGDYLPIRDLDEEGPIIHLEQYIRELVEATQHDPQFKTLMDSGFDGIKQAMELADHLGIPSQELPWDFESVDEWVWEMRDEPSYAFPEILEPTGWTKEEYRSAAIKAAEAEHHVPMPPEMQGSWDWLLPPLNEDYERELVAEDVEKRQAFSRDVAATGQTKTTYPGFSSSLRGEDAVVKDSLKAGRKIKKIFAKYADRDFLNSLVTVHWLNSSRLRKAIETPRKNEMSVAAYLPRNFESSPSYIVGLLIKGHITLLANEMDDLYTGYGRAVEKYTSQHRTKSSGVNKGVGIVYAPEEYASREILVLDAEDFKQNPSNEALVDNWEIIGIIVESEDFIPEVEREIEGLNMKHLIMTVDEAMEKL